MLSTRGVMDLTKLNNGLREIEELFTVDEKNLLDTVEEKIERLRDKNITKYRVKTIRSGEMLECEIYPLWNAPKAKRKKKEKTERLAQSKLNDKNAKKHLIRLVNTNFTKEDIWITLTYQNGKLPSTFEDAKKNMQNYIRRLKRYIKKHKLPELKYIYVTEYQDASAKKKKRIHHHMILNFRDRDKAEELWNGGGRTQSRRLQPDEFGLEGLTRYITKDKNEDTMKRYTPSRNLTEPTITVADSKITRRKAEKIATNENDAQPLFEKLYPNYQFNDMQVKYSPYNSGAYIYVRMKQIAPKKPKRKRGRQHE